jgi:hypothetical protein
VRQLCLGEFDFYELMLSNRVAAPVRRSLACAKGHRHGSAASMQIAHGNCACVRTVQALFIFFLFLIVFTVLNIFVAIIDFNYGQVHLVTALQSAPCKCVRIPHPCAHSWLRR